MPIDLERRGPVAILTLNRPEALNALSPALLDELEERLDGIERSADTQVVVQPPLFGQMTSGDVLIADMWSTGMTTDDHPVSHVRPGLDARRVLSVDDLATAETGRRIEVGGIVTHRQRPATASGSGRSTASSGSSPSTRPPASARSSCASTPPTGPTSWATSCSSRACAC